MEEGRGSAKRTDCFFCSAILTDVVRGEEFQETTKGKGGEVKSLSTTLEGKVFLLDKGSGDEERDTMLREIEREERAMGFLNKRR